MWRRTLVFLLLWRGESGGGGGASRVMRARSNVASHRLRDGVFESETLYWTYGRVLARSTVTALGFGGTRQGLFVEAGAC
jgi:hypothetical protein